MLRRRLTAGQGLRFFPKRVSLLFGYLCIKHLSRLCESLTAYSHATCFWLSFFFLNSLLFLRNSFCFSSNIFLIGCILFDKIIYRSQRIRRTLDSLTHIFVVLNIFFYIVGRDDVLEIRIVNRKL